MCNNHIANKNDIKIKNHGKKCLSKTFKTNKKEKKENKLRSTFNMIKQDEWLAIFSYMAVVDIINCGMTSSTLLNVISSSEKVKRRIGVEHTTVNDQIRSKVRIDLNEVNLERMEILRKTAISPYKLMLNCSNVDTTSSDHHNDELEKRIIMTLDYVTRNNLHFGSIEKLSIDLSNVEVLSPSTCVAVTRFISQQRNVNVLELKMHPLIDLFDELNGLKNTSIRKFVDKSPRTNPANVCLMFPMLDTLECCQLFLPYLSFPVSQTLTTLKLEELCFNSIRHLYAPNLESLTAKFVARIDIFWEVFVQQHPFLEYLNIEKLLHSGDYAEIINSLNLFTNLKTFMHSGRMIVSNV